MLVCSSMPGDSGGLQQLLQPVRIPADPAAIAGVARASPLQHFDQPQLHRGIEHLRVGEAREKIEKLPGTCPAYRPKQRKCNGKALKGGRSQQSVARRHATGRGPGPEAAPSGQAAAVREERPVTRLRETAVICWRQLFSTGAGRNGRHAPSASRSSKCAIAPSKPSSARSSGVVGLVLVPWLAERFLRARDIAQVIRHLEGLADGISPASDQPSGS
jgi:hypothetical protein